MDVDITGGSYHGNLYVAYMDDAQGMTDTDIYFTRSTDGGVNWSAKVRINDDPLNNGCDQFHPWLTVTPDGNIVVVFLDRRLDSNNLLMDLYMTTSTDAGTTWSPNERITTVSSDPTAGLHLFAEARALSFYPKKLEEPIILADRAGLLGEYIGVAASSVNDIHPIWTDTRLGNQDVFMGVRDSASPVVQEHIEHNTTFPALFTSPNPAIGNITIKIAMGRWELATHRSLNIYDISGRLVKSFHQPRERIVWDRRDDHGVVVRSGVYFCCLKMDSHTAIKKITLLPVQAR
jgi:hypothetical protein